MIAIAEKSFSVRLSANTDSYERAMARSAAATASFATAASSNVTKAGATLNKVGGQLTRNVTLPLIGVGGAAVKMAAAFDTSMNRMVALAGVTADQVDGLRDSVLDLAGRTAQSPQQLADALYQASSSGLKTADALKAVELAAKGAAAGMGSAQDIVSLVASATAAYGSANIDAARATDVLTAAIREGRADPTELAGTLGRILPIANQVGISFEEVGGAVAYLSNVTGDTARTVTQMQGILVKLSSPTQQGRQALLNMGTSVKELHAAIADNGLLGALELLKTHGFESNAQAMAQLFDDIEGRQGALTLMADETGQLGNVMDRVAGSTGALDNAFDVMSQTASFKMKAAWSEAQVALIEAGTIMLPIVTSLASHIGDIAQAFSDLPGPVQAGILALGGMVALVGPMAMLASKAINVSKAFADVGISAKSLGAAVGITTALVAGAAVAYSLYNAKKAEAEQRTRDLAAALLDESGAQNEALAALANDDGRVKAFLQAQKDLGLSTADVAQYMRDGTGPAAELASAYASVTAKSEDGFTSSKAVAKAMGLGTDATDAQIQSMAIFGVQLADLRAGELARADAAALVASVTNDETAAVEYATSRMATLDRANMSGAMSAEELAAKEADAKAALDAEAAAMKASEDATKALHDALAPLSTLFDTMAHEADVLDGALRRVLGGQLSMEDATAGLYAGAQALTDAFKDNGKTLDINTEAGRKNRAAVESQVKGILDYGSAIVGAGGSIEDATGSMQFLRQGLIDQMVHLGLTKDAAAAYIDQLGLTPDNIVTAVNIAGDELTREKLQGMVDDLKVIDAGAAASIQVLVDQGQLAAAERSLNTLVRARAASFMISIGGNVHAHAEGGYIGRPMISTLGEGGLPEVVLPLTKPGRIAELMADPRVSGPILNAVGPLAASAQGRAVNVPRSMSVTSSATPVVSTTADTDEITLARRQYQRGALSLTQFEDILERKRAGLELYSEAETAIYDELQQLHETKAREDAAIADEQIAHEDKVQAYLYESGQITLAQYQGYLGGRRDAFKVMSDEWFALNDKMVAAQRDGDRAIADGTQLLFDQAAARQELADATDANIAADAARNDAAAKAWATGADKNATADEKTSANEAFKQSEAALAKTAFRLADATANARGIEDRTPEWARFMRERLQADIAWNAAQGRNGVVEALQRELLSVPSFASGGFMPATRGGALVRVAEAGQGEFMVPANLMHVATGWQGGPSGGSQDGQAQTAGNTYNFSTSIQGEPTARTLAMMEFNNRRTRLAMLAGAGAG